MPSRWATQKLENNNANINTTQYPMLWRSWAPCHALQLGDPVKAKGIPRKSDLEGQWDLITGTETLLLEVKTKLLHVWEPRGKDQWRHRRLNQTYLLVLEGLMWGQGLAVACHRGTSRSNFGRYPLAWALLKVITESTIRSTDSRAGLIQVRQITGRGANSPMSSVLLAQLLQSYPALCNCMDSSPQGSTVHGIL